MNRKTKILKINSPSEAERIQRAAEIIKNGGLCVIPTETVYGLAANALDEKAVDDIFAAKMRPCGNPLTVHICDFDDIYMYAKNVPDSAVRLAERFFPGPLTLILEKSDMIPLKITAGADRVGLRMPDDEVSRMIIRKAGVPVVATSANLSGSPSPTSISHVLSDLTGRVDAIADCGEPPLGIESTVIDMTADVPKILRLGVIGVREIESVIGGVQLDERSSPAANLKHYSVGKRVVLVIAGLDEFRKYVEGFGDDFCVMCFDGEEKYFNAPCIAYGSENSPIEQAKRLFSALREVGKNEAKTVFIRCAHGGDSVSLAVFDHLMKAADGNCIRLSQNFGGTEYEIK